jgi:two-component system response regulator HydG
MLETALSTEGYSVDVAITATEAWALLARHSYALVVADWRLPDGNGLELVNQAADGGIKTMIVSGYLFQLRQPDPRHEYLMKPMRPTEFAGAIARLLNSESVPRRSH